MRHQWAFRHCFSACMYHYVWWALFVLIFVFYTYVLTIFHIQWSYNFNYAYWTFFVQIFFVYSCSFINLLMFQKHSTFLKKFWLPLYFTPQLTFSLKFFDFSRVVLYVCIDYFTINRFIHGKYLSIFQTFCILLRRFGYLYLCMIFFN